MSTAEHVTFPNADVPTKRLELYLAIATVVLSPMNYLRLEAVYFTVGDFFGFATLVVMLLNRRIPLAFFGPATSFWLLSLGLYLGGLVIGSVVHGDAVAGLIVFVQYCYSLIVIPLIISARRLEETLLLMKVLIYSITAIMLLGVLLIAFVPDVDPRLVSGSGRLRSLLERENAAGAMAAIAITFSIYLRLIGLFRLTVFVPVMAILFYGLMSTGSNTGLGATVLGVGLLLLFMGQVRAILVALVFATVSIVIVVYFGELFLPEIFQKRVFGALSTGDIDKAGTFVDRFDLIHEALEVANSTVFLGLGADQYRVISDHNAPVHNIYLLILSEGGLVSLLGLLGLFLTGVAISLRTLRFPNGWKRGALTLTMVILFALLLNAFAHFYARFWHVPLTLALSLSLPRGGHSIYPYRLS